MKIFDEIDDQVLGAFVDGQLDAEISELIIIKMDSNIELRDRIYKLRRTKDLMKLGFSKACAPSNFHHTDKVSKWKQWKRYAMTIAATVTAVTISLGSGAFGYYFGTQDDLLLNGSQTTAIQQRSDRILLHISESDINHFAATLDYAEKFLIKHEARGGEIAVVANAGGLDLMRSGISPFENKVRHILEKYKNVYFIACANSVRKLREKGLNPNLIDNVTINKPAIDHIIDYVQGGWTYKKAQSLIKT